MRKKVQWIQDEKNHKSLLLNDLTLNTPNIDCYAAYIIGFFDENDKPFVVRTGIKEPRDNLIIIGNSPTIKKYTEHGLYITWAKSDPRDLERIWAYLCKELKPLETPHYYRDNPLPINLPKIVHKDSWKDFWDPLSLWYRKEQGWKCEHCNIDLKDKSRFLHTHHIRGHGYNRPEDLKALCIECHSNQKQPSDHSFMRDDPEHNTEYNKFMEWKNNL